MAQLNKKLAKKLTLTHTFKKEIYSENHLNDFLIKEWGLLENAISVLERKKISPRSIADLIVCSAEGLFYIIELKFRPIRHRDLKQVKRYWQDYWNLASVDTVEMILVGYDSKEKLIQIYSVNN